MAANVGQPDEGLEMRTEVQNRLLRQKKAVAKGERGEELEEVEKRLAVEGVEDRPERQPSNADIPEQTILLPERAKNSVPHIAALAWLIPIKPKTLRCRFSLSNLVAF